MAGHPHFTGAHARRIFTFLKVIRAGGWMTRKEVIERLKMTPSSDQHKLLELMYDEGFLDRRKRGRPPGQGGPEANEYRVAREWRNDQPT